LQIYFFGVIDVSKCKSKVAVAQPFGRIIRKPFDVSHTSEELRKLADLILSLDGESRVVMEHTGKYSEPIADFLCENGIFVSLVNAKLVHDYGGDTIRRVKTDNVDELKIGAYCLDKWANLSRYAPTDEIRKMLKTYNRQLSEYVKIKTMLKNNLISLLDQTFPHANELFSSPAREKDGHEKWIDFVASFPHCHCVTSLTKQRFLAKYEKFCRKNDYNFSVGKAEEIYSSATACFPTLPSGSPHLRKTLFQVMCCVLQLSHFDEPTFQFLDKKRSEGKPYKVYMIAGANKFLRIYYARVSKCIQNGIKSFEIGNNMIARKQDSATVETDVSGYAGLAIPIAEKTAARTC